MYALSRLRPRALSPFRLLVGGAGIALALLIVVPLVSMLGDLFIEDGRPTLAGVRSLSGEPVGEVLRNTVILTVASGALALVVGSLLAWVNERTDARIGALTDTLPIVSFLIPPFAGALGWMMLASPGAGYLNSYLRRIIGSDARTGPLNIHSWWGLTFVYALYMVPYVFIMVSASLRDLDASLEEQSRVAGVGKLRTVFKVTVPSIKPAIAGAGYLLVWFGFSMFSIPAVLGPRAGIETLSMRIVQMIRYQYPPRFDAAVSLGLVTFAAVACAWAVHRYTIRNARFATVGGKSRRAARLRLGAWRWPVRLMMLLYIVVAAILPMLALLALTMRGYWSARIELHQWDFSNVTAALFDNPVTRRALVNSLRLATMASIIGITVAALIAVLIRKARGPWAVVVDAAIKLPASLPNVVLALAFLSAFAGPPFRLHGTTTILLLAYLAFYLPQAAVAADSAASLVGDEMIEASSVSGVGSGRTFARISAPLMFPGLLAGWAFLFARVLGELNAASILATGNNVVMGSRMLDLLGGGPQGYAALGALALAITVVGLVIIGITFTLGRLVGRGYRQRST